MKCRYCGVENPLQAEFCENCGKEFLLEERIQWKCEEIADLMRQEKKMAADRQKELNLLDEEIRHFSTQINQLRQERGGE